MKEKGGMWEKEMGEKGWNRKEKGRKGKDEEDWKRGRRRE
jgi:hypothetical protein